VGRVGDSLRYLRQTLGHPHGDTERDTEREVDVGGRGGSSSAITKERMLEDLNALMREQGRLGPEQQIQKAYEQLQSQSKYNIPWVGLAELRNQLSGLTRERQDQALMGLLRQGLIRLIPEENQKTITPADRAAAIVLKDGEPKHLIAFKSKLNVGY